MYDSLFNNFFSAAYVIWGCFGKMVEENILTLKTECVISGEKKFNNDYIQNVHPSFDINKVIKSGH
jgi:hypothetical protein